jgi:hypothetical protein
LATKKVSIEVPENCQVCGKPGTHVVATRACKEDIDLARDGLIYGIKYARQKKAEQEGAFEEKPEEPEEPIENPIRFETDQHMIRMLYPDSNPRQQIYMDMENPTKDPLFRNEENANLQKGYSGGWTATGTADKAQVRLELWQDNPIRDCEITVYTKYLTDYGPGIAEPGAYASQVYRGGGHHSSKDMTVRCEGCAYKARIRKDRSVVIVKEVRHDDYTSNKGGIKKLRKDPKGNFIGVKLVIYNLMPQESEGRIPVKIEVWCDEEGMTNTGTFSPTAQRWEKYAEYIDAGDWASGDGGACPPVELGNMGRRMGDEILNTPKGAPKGNLAAYRTDGALTELKFFSFRKIKNPVGAA